VKRRPRLVLAAVVLVTRGAVNRRPRLVLGAVVLVALLGAGFGRAATHRADGTAGANGANGALPASAAVPDDVPPLTDAPGGGAWRAARTAEARKGRWTAHLERAAVLRAAPDGRQVAHVGRKTGYGARRVYAVAAFRPGWVGVRALQRPNATLAWLPEDAVRLQPVRTTLVADLSDRELTLRVDGEVRDRAAVGIGRPGSETPAGHYGVTDRLRGGGGGLGAVYGCCIIPLTGHQPKLPPGWAGGTRLALHATPTPGTVGQEVSAGCLRMRDEDIRRMLPAVPLGATMTVRR